jgi:hypothetical protein
VFLLVVSVCVSVVCASPCLCVCVCVCVLLCSYSLLWQVFLPLCLALFEVIIVVLVFSLDVVCKLGDRQVEESFCLMSVSGLSIQRVPGECVCVVLFFVFAVLAMSSSRLGPCSQFVCWPWGFVTSEKGGLSSIRNSFSARLWWCWWFFFFFLLARVFCIWICSAETMLEIIDYLNSESVTLRLLQNGRAYVRDLCFVLWAALGRLARFFFPG